MAKHFGDDTLIYSWMRNRNTLEYLGIWEVIHNPGFKGNEFETFKSQSGLNSFNLTPRKWIEATRAIGIQSRAGRHGGGTFAHPDIAYEFGAWLSPEFKLYLIKEFQRLKEAEAERQGLEWNLNRALSKLNYRIHTDAIKERLVPPTLTKRQESFVYADEADMLNVALFGKTAKQWRDANPELEGNMRDNATAAQLLVMVNLESLNAEFVRQGMSQAQRLQKLRAIAVQQLTSLQAISLRALDKPGTLPMDGDDEHERE
ncbi:MAG: KilA-N domain-containing protein [Fimbriimonadaceae bacterium]|nr:KilA-N domain-containing protein [Fimbriimonadaceae bacterium]